MYTIEAFNYEKMLVNKLQVAGMMPLTATNAGCSANDPDAFFVLKGQKHLIEIKKNKKAVFGQIELRYLNRWDVSENSKLSYPMTYRFIHKSGFLDKVNDNWKKPTGVYEEDLKMGNIRDCIEGLDGIVSHYVFDRKTDYLQIGGLGFFHLYKDSAKLGTPKFKGDTKLRARIKYRKTDPKTGIKKYGTLITFEVTGTNKSHFNLE